MNSWIVRVEWPIVQIASERIVTIFGIVHERRDSPPFDADTSRPAWMEVLARLLTHPLPKTAFLIGTARCNLALPFYLI